MNPKILAAISGFYESDSFSDSSLRRIFDSESLGFPSLRKMA